MYTLHVDLHVYYNPPMEEFGPGIVFTRQIELPFPAYNGLRIHSSAFDSCPTPMGYTLKEVIWDVDRSVFVAKTKHMNSGFAIAEILGELRALVMRGWRYGSYVDDYPDPEDHPIELGSGPSWSDSGSSSSGRPPMTDVVGGTGPRAILMQSIGHLTRMNVTQHSIGSTGSATSPSCPTIGFQTRSKSIWPPTVIRTMESNAG